MATLRVMGWEKLSLVLGTPTWIAAIELEISPLMVAETFSAWKLWKLKFPESVLVIWVAGGKVAVKIVSWIWIWVLVVTSGVAELVPERREI